MGLKISEKGKNFKGKWIDEDNLCSGSYLMWRNKIYYAGNRYHHLVELWKNKKFVRTVSMRHVFIVIGDVYDE